MQLQVFITGNTNIIHDILSGFLKAGISGTTIIECEGGLQVLGHSDMEDMPTFGNLRRFLNPAGEHGKMLITVLQDDQVAEARGIILDNVGDISLPGRGILFTVPVGSAEGLSKQQK